MQSDRLLSLLFLLQARGRVSARQLAEELEVSKRTIYRDIDALSAAGVPVYAERGRNGGCSLLPGYRTDVMGLSPAEARALFVFTGRGVPGDLGMEADLRSGLRKLMAAVPAAARPDAARAADRVLVDPRGWMRDGDQAPALGALQEAVWGDRRIRLRYRGGDAAAARDADVDPYGLVAKAGVWYLVGGERGEPRMFRASRVERVSVTDEPATRPAGLDLDVLWTQLRREFEARGGEGYPVRVLVPHHIDGLFLRVVGPRTTARPEAERDDGSDASAAGTSDAGTAAATSAAATSVVYRMTFPAEGAAVAALLAFGADVEALGPPALRARLRAAGAAIDALYTGPGGVP